MKNLVIVVLAVALALLGVLHLQALRSSKTAAEKEAVASKETAQTVMKYVTITNELTVAQTETAAVKSQLVARTSELEQRTAEKTKADEQLVQVQTQLRQQTETFRKDMEIAQQVAQRQITEQASKIKALETERGQLKQSLATTSNQLGVVKKKFSDLQREHTETLALVEKLRQQIMRLEMENASLQRRLNDLTALREQVRIVKQRMWDDKLAEVKHQNEEGLAKGNRGFILREGRWTLPASQPLK